MEISSSLLKRCKKNKEGSFEELFKVLYSPIFKICLIYTSCEDQANEYLQQGFIKIFQKIDYHKDPGNFEAWAKTVVKNNIIDDLRKEKNFVSLEEVSEKHLVTEDINPDDIDPSLTNYEILKKIQHLPPSYRTVFNMYVFEGLTHSEIAEYLNVTISTSKSHYHKARKKLKNLLLKNVV